MAVKETRKLPGLVTYSPINKWCIYSSSQKMQVYHFSIERDAFSVKNSLCKNEGLDLGVKPLLIRLHWMFLPPPPSPPSRFSITRAAIDLSLEETPTYYYFSVSAGRPPLGQMPFIVTPEGKILAQSGTIMKYICKKGGDILNVIC